MNEYRQLLLSTLGERDALEVQAETPAVLRDLVAEAGSDVRTRPEAGEWSVYQCIGHIVDAELVIAGRYRWILAHDQPDILPYDQDLWADRFHGDQTEEIDGMLTLFETVRRADIDLWRTTPPQDRARFGLHRERGPESYELTFKLTAGHDLVHTDQARQALAQVRAARG